MRIIFIAVFMLGSCFSMAQGCSDAGFCTMGAMKPDQAYSNKIDLKLRSVEFNYYHGKTTLTPIVTVYTLDLGIGINDNNSIQLKLPYQTVQGDLGETRGMGDISVSASHIFPSAKDGNFGVTLGAKIPSGKSDKKNTDPDRPLEQLPMYYQISLGTYDLIAGGSYINEKWLFATGIQVPLIHQNQNDFRWGKWTTFEDPSYPLKYELANDLKRGTDVMLRVERNFRFVNYNFSIGALPIYRITKDERFNFNTNERMKIEGSTGLALSLLGSFGYQFNVSNSIKLIYGHKLAQRDENPDGLTRKYVVSFSYVYRF